MKIFVIAFACEPNRTSEPGVGWNIVGELAKRHEITVLTRCNNRDCIEAYIAENPESSYAKIKWEYYDLAEWFHKLKKKITCGIQLYQELWQFWAAKKYKDEFAKHDVVHHLTFGSIFFTPWAARYSDRFVWGPIGGASGAMETAFLKNENFRSRISEMFYRLVTWYSFHPVPWAAKLRKRCRAIIFRTSELAAGVKLGEDQTSAVVPETAYAGEMKQRKYEVERHPLKIMSVGRLIPLKGVKYTIQAFAKFIESGGEGELNIYGDGPLRTELESLAMVGCGFNTETQRRSETSVRSAPLRLCVKKTKGGGTITFHGNVPNSEILAALDSADVLVHSSFREGGSWTILEAMAHGVPVICQERAGMKDMVTDECGVKIASRAPNELVDGITDAMCRYYRNPAIVQEHGLSGQERVRRKYSWATCVDLIDDVFHVSELG